MKQDKFKLFLEERQAEKDPIAIFSNEISLYIYMLATEEDTTLSKNYLLFEAEKMGETGTFFIKVCSLLYNAFNRYKITEAKNAFSRIKAVSKDESKAQEYFFIIRSNDNWTIEYKPIKNIPEIVQRFYAGFKKRNKYYSNNTFSFTPQEPKDEFSIYDESLGGILDKLSKETGKFFYNITWNNTNEYTKLFLAKVPTLPPNFQDIIKKVSNTLFHLFYSEQETKCFKMWNVSSFTPQSQARVELEKIIKYQRRNGWKIHGENITKPDFYCYKVLKNKGFSICN